MLTEALEVAGSGTYQTGTLYTHNDPAWVVEALAGALKANGWTEVGQYGSEAIFIFYFGPPVQSPPSPPIPEADKPFYTCDGRYASVRISNSAVIPYVAQGQLAYCFYDPTRFRPDPTAPCILVALGASKASTMDNLASAVTGASPFDASAYQDYVPIMHGLCWHLKLVSKGTGPLTVNYTMTGYGATTGVVPRPYMGGYKLRSGLANGKTEYYLKLQAWWDRVRIGLVDVVDPAFPNEYILWFAVRDHVLSKIDYWLNSYQLALFRPERVLTGYGGEGGAAVDDLFICAPAVPSHLSGDINYCLFVEQAQYLCRYLNWTSAKRRVALNASLSYPASYAGNPASTRCFGIVMSRYDVSNTSLLTTDLKPVVQNALISLPQGDQQSRVVGRVWDAVVTTEPAYGVESMVHRGELWRPLASERGWCAASAGTLWLKDSMGRVDLKAY